MQKRLSFLLLFFVLIGNKSFSQFWKDTIRIEATTITSERLFKKENAGMKSVRIDSVVLQQKTNLSLSELLSENTQIFIKNHGRGALATASFRGTAASHTQVNWNGININSPMAGMVDFSQIPVYVIDDMNLKHGTSSIADQSGGLGGSINISNRPEWNKKFYAKALLGLGSYGTHDEFVQVGGGNQKLHLKLRMYHSFSENDYTFINRGIGNINPETGELTNPLDTNKNADYRRCGLLQEVYYRPNTKNLISAKYWGQWSDRTIPQATSYEGSDNSNLNKQLDNDNKMVVNWLHFYKKHKFSLRSGYSQKHIDYSLMNNVLGIGLIPAIYSESTQKSSLNTAAYSTNITKNLSLEAKIDFNYHYVISQDSVAKTGYEQTRQDVSAFAAVRYNFFDRINLNLMLRQEFSDYKISPFSPFLGFDFKILKDSEFLFKGNVAHNFHQPTLNDLYWQPGGNPNLLPENGISGELGLEYQRNTKLGLVKAEITAYRSDVSNWIIWVPSYKGYWEPQNIKRVLSQGVECNLSLKGKIKDFEYNIAANYAYTSSVNLGNKAVWGDESYGKQLVYVPLHSGNLLVNLCYKGFFVTYQFNSYSERFTTSSNDITQRDWLYPYFMNDLTVGKSFSVKKAIFTAEFKIYNLFNETYHSILYRPMPKQNYMLLLMVNL